jgi:hypothetical protein
LADRLTALARRMARKQEAEAATLPPVRHATLLIGLLMTSCGWWVLGLSLWAMLQAVAPDAMFWTWQGWLRWTGYIALAYVVGFFTFFVPGGLGTRDWILQVFVARELAADWPGEEAHALAWGVAFLLRLLWLAAEVIMAGVVYLLSSPWMLGPAQAADSAASSAVPNGQRTTDNGQSV